MEPEKEMVLFETIYENGLPRAGRSRGDGQYESWRKRVFKRDEYTCQNCGRTDAELNAHHIKSWAEYPEQRFDTDNGMTLCVECHKEEHSTAKGGD